MYRFKWKQFSSEVFNKWAKQDCTSVVIFNIAWAYVLCYMLCILAICLYDSFTQYFVYQYFLLKICKDEPDCINLPVKYCKYSDDIARKLCQTMMVNQQVFRHMNLPDVYK